jgi:SNF2 family DNA or RNA helicase
LGTVETQANEWIQRSKKLLNINRIPKIPKLAKFNGTLRKYQKLGYNWLSFLAVNRFGAVLADDMGLGKTVQIIAMLQGLKERAADERSLKTLIICPTSVVFNSSNEFRKFAPGLNTLALFNTLSKSNIDLNKEIDNNDVIITSYAIAQRDEEELGTIDRSFVIIDEAQYIKNYNSKTYAAIKKLNAVSKIALTGTPLENNLMELWAIYSVVAPGLFADRMTFKEVYQKPIESRFDAACLARLRTRIRPFMLRRTKDQVLNELPQRIEQVLSLDLVSSHRRIYDAYLSRERQKIMGLLDDFKKKRFKILSSLTTLRMLSLSAALVDREKYSNIPSIKILTLLEYLEEIFNENHKALVFSQFTSFLAEVKAACDDKHINYSYLDGSTKNREQVINTFKSIEVPLFLISLKAGGVGLNLVEADYCFILDPW